MIRTGPGAHPGPPSPRPDKYQAMPTAVFRDELNPKLWDETNLRPEVRLRLLRTARAFYEFLNMTGLRLNDILLVGSNAGYNWTPTSDVDLHLVVDYARSTCPDLASDFFDTKRLLWNKSHQVSIHGYPVELYVEDRETPNKSLAVYSVFRGGWLYPPQKSRPRWDDRAVALKTTSLAAEAESMLNASNKDEFNRFLDRLSGMRKSGLASGGEFSVENLTYKALRGMGVLDRIRDARREAEDRELSL